MAPPPELNDDATAEILLRLPPEEPAHLVRAALVCRPWRQILTDPGFLRRYRTFHRAPPLLGFFDNHLTSDRSRLPRFFSTLEAASPFPSQAIDRANWRVLDCRHGRVLFLLFDERVNLVVWDPATGDHQGLLDPAPPSWPHDYTAAVLCSVRGCDHLDCHGGPFRMILATSDYSGGIEVVVRVRLYSSEAGTWISSAHLGPCHHVSRKLSALVGCDVYFRLLSDNVILRYDMERNRLSTVHLPAATHASKGSIGLIPMEDGSLGLAGIIGSWLCMWSTNVSPEGIAGWVRCWDIELMTGIPVTPSSEAHVIGSAEGLGIIFVVTDVGLFMVHLKSGRKRKVDDDTQLENYFAVFPFMSFHAPDCTSSKFPSLASAHY